MATSQPIALPAPNTDNNMDYAMGSYTGSHGGPFNPASYTRHFLGSPISWRAGSFGSRFPQGSPSAHLFSSLDNTKPSIDDVSVLNAFNVFDREGELCRNYNCCGLHLQDLHALLEHFEEVHVLVADPQAPAQIAVPFNPQPLAHQPSFDSDDMELELDLDNSTHPQSLRSSPDTSSPPHTPSNPTLAQFAHQYGFTTHHQSPYTSAQTSPYTSQPPSPGSGQPQVHFPHAGPGTQSVLTHPEEVFNTYARFSADYSSHMPGTQFNPSGGEEIHVSNPSADFNTAPYPQAQQGQGQCIPPALLFASNNNNPTSNELPTNKLKLKVRGGQVGSASTPTTPSTTSALTPFNNTAPPTSAPPIISTNSTPAPPSTATTPARTPSHTPLPAAPSLLLSKPFRCPKPNCNKSYKQANGLKYHMTHGSCNFAPPKDLEHVKDLLERKRREREASSGLSRSASLGSLSHPAEPLVNAQGEPLLHNLYGDLGCITETELREVEREAEKRVRPFACGVGDCQRRYKNMNGLRYHYQHSGDHGAVGLALLAGGLHECLGNNQNHNNGVNNASSTGSDGGKAKHGHVQEEREGRRRAAAPAGVRGIMRGGASSTPVSRATSVSRVGTPVPVPMPGAMPMQKSASAYPATSSGLGVASGSGTASGVATPFTPGYTNPAAANAIANDVMTHMVHLQQQQQQQQQQHSSPLSQAQNNNSPPLTPLTAAVQGLGLSSGSPTRSAFSPQPQQQQTAPQPIQPSQSQQQQGEQQLAYQAQFVELQRRQYMQMQQQQAQFQAQQQAQQQQQQQQRGQFQQYSPSHLQQSPQQQAQYVLADADARAQQEFVDAQRREFEAQLHQHQQQQQQQQQGGMMGMGDVAMA
ncbi:hypothetical protein C0991_005589 [Blastosporella zonata]|nr:hypothetical protein C0991_005589 [Blastosporella zonata]